MTDDVKCVYDESDDIGDEDAFALMAEAFSRGFIPPADRPAVLRLFTGASDLLFVLAEGSEGEEVASRIAGASTIRLSPEVQRRLVARFKHWLEVN